MAGRLRIRLSARSTNSISRVILKTPRRRHRTTRLRVLLFCTFFEFDRHLQASNYFLPYSVLIGSATVCQPLIININSFKTAHELRRISACQNRVVPNKHAQLPSRPLVQYHDSAVAKHPACFDFVFTNFFCTHPRIFAPTLFDLRDCITSRGFSQTKTTRWEVFVWFSFQNWNSPGEAFQSIENHLTQLLTDMLG